MMAKTTLLPLDEAIETVIAAAIALREAKGVSTRTMSLWEAAGSVLAEDVRADLPLPPFDKATKEGFAVRGEDFSGLGPEDSKRFRLVGELTAGEMPPRALFSGETMAITTGAPLPEGADTVVPYVFAVREGPNEVSLRGGFPLGANVARKGEQAQEGDIVVEKGRVIESLTSGVLASAGRERVDVYQRPRVTVVATGDELVNFEDEPGPAQIRDANRRTLMALAESEYGRVVDGGIAQDDPEALRSAIREGLCDDVLVLSGGVSTSSQDLVRESFIAEGVEIVFDEVALKPGRRVIFGRTPSTLVFGLPGNPVSAFVTAATLLAPALRVLGYRPECRSWYLKVPIEGHGDEAPGQALIPATAERTTIHPATITRSARGELKVKVERWDDSADHVHYSRSNCLIRREAHSPEVKAGEVVSVLLPGALVQW